MHETAAPFIAGLSPNAPLGFAAVDVDYYSSAKAALELMAYPDPAKYLTTVALYLDDIYWESQNPWCGELLAVTEFNEAQTLRKIAPDHFLRSRRVFKNARWIDQMFLLHVLDHSERNQTQPTRPVKLYAALR